MGTAMNTTIKLTTDKTVGKTMDKTMARNMIMKKTTYKTMNSAVGETIQKTLGVRTLGMKIKLDETSGVKKALGLKTMTKNKTLGMKTMKMEKEKGILMSKDKKTMMKEKMMKENRGSDQKDQKEMYEDNLLITYAGCENGTETDISNESTFDKHSNILISFQFRKSMYFKRHNNINRFRFQLNEPIVDGKKLLEDMENMEYKEQEHENEEHGNDEIVEVDMADFKDLIYKFVK